MRWLPEEQVGLKSKLTTCMQMLALVGQDMTVGQLQAIFPNLFGGNISLTVIQASTGHTAGYVVFSADDGMIVFVAGGISRADQVVSLFGGWTATTNQTVDGYDWPFAYSAQDYIGAATIPSNVTWETMVVVGHSWGGATAYALLGLCPGMKAQAEKFIYTFGAPKPGRAPRTQQWIQGVKERRCFGFSDPVPGLPPTGGNMGSWPARCNTSQLGSLMSWSQPSLGLMLEADQVPTVSPNPSAFGVFTGLSSSVADYLMGDLAFGSQFHSQNYYTGLVSSIQDQGRGFWETLDDFMPVTPVVPSVRQRQTIIDQAVAGQSSMVQSNLALTAQQLQAQAAGLGKAKWHGVKLRGHRALYYGDTFITWLHSRRTQIKLVRFLNRELPGESGFQAFTGVES